MCPVIFQLTLCLSAFYLPVSFFPCVETLRVCPHQCLCYDPSDLVDCRDQSFKHIPRGIPHGAWLLELGGNNLSHIGTRAFTGLWSLRVLVLTNCQIKEVEPQVEILKHLYNLTKEKKMQESNPANDERILLFSSLFPQAFFSLSFLEKLDLSWNLLTSLPVDFSASLSALRELRLQHNSLHHLTGYR